jgi:hypothetical protein
MTMRSATIGAGKLLLLPLIVLAFAVAGLPGSAAASQATAAASQASADRGWGTADSTAVAKGESVEGYTSATGSCSRSVSIPAYSITFECTVTSGAIRLYIICSDGARFNSQIYFAPASFRVTGTCGPPWTVRTSGVESVF